MLRASGWDLVTMHEHYGKARSQTVDDVTWIGELSAQGFALLTSDARIVRNIIEANAIVEYRAVVFMLPKGDMTSDEMARRFETHRSTIDARTQLGGPAGYAVYERIVSRVFP
jgi:hypothetical protein